MLSINEAMQYWRMKRFTVFADGDGNCGFAGVHTVLQDEDLDKEIHDGGHWRHRENTVSNCRRESHKVSLQVSGPYTN